MKDACEKAVKVLAEKITSETKADDAQKYTQSALNLAHVLATIANMKNNE